MTESNVLDRLALEGILQRMRQEQSLTKEEQLRRLYEESQRKPDRKYRVEVSFQARACLDVVAGDSREAEILAEQRIYSDYSRDFQDIGILETLSDEIKGGC